MPDATTADTPAPSGLKGLIARVQKLKPVRVFQHYGRERGPILASGLAYSAIFAVFAALWVGFSIIGAIISEDLGLRTTIIRVISDAVPGLIDTGLNDGAIDPDDLLNTAAFTWTGSLALLGLLVTALGWLDAARNAVRVLFDLPPAQGNIIMLKLKDLAIALGFGTLLIVSGALTFLGTQATDLVLGALGLGETVVATVLSRIVSLAVMFALDVAVLGALFRVLAGLHIPLAQLRGGTLVGAALLGLLKILGTALLGGATSNPLLASFAVIIGLLIFFNLVCQVILISAAWIAISVSDADLVLDETVAAQRLEAARALVAQHDIQPDQPQGFWARRRARRDLARAERELEKEAVRADGAERGRSAATD
jgi:membrane protein